MLTNKLVQFESIWDTKTKSLLTSNDGELRLLPWRQYLNMCNVLSSVIIFRGMGFRANLLRNTSTDTECEYVASNYYLHVKVGYSFNSFIAIPSGIDVRVSKRDRKVVITGFSGALVSRMKQQICKMRLPNVYTGRGARSKGEFYIRKLGKKDARGTSKAW